MKKRKQYVPYSAVDKETQEVLVMTGTTTIKIKMSSSALMESFHRGMTWLGHRRSASGFQFCRPRNSNLSDLEN